MLNSQIIKRIRNYLSCNYKKAEVLFAKETHLKHYYKNIALNPLIISDREYKNIKFATEHIGKILEKTVKIYFQNKKMQDFFQFDSRQKNIIQNFNPKMRAMYLARFDGSITKNNKFKFLEFNINHPGGTERLDNISQIENNFLRKLGIKLNNFNNIFLSYLKTVGEIYKKYAVGSGAMAMIYGSRFDEHDRKALEVIAQSIQKKYGFKVFITHLENLHYNNKIVTYKKHRISLIYRAELLHRFWQYDYKIITPILAALKNNHVAMYNSTSAYLCGTKNLFALWYEPWFQKLLTVQEIKTIKKYIPKTYGLNSSILTKEQLINNKNQWVIKPTQGFGGTGVHIGCQLDSKKWQKIVESHYKSRLWIAQEFVPAKIYTIFNLDTCEQNITESKGFLNISPWYINGKMAGISARYSKNLVINIKKGGGIMGSAALLTK